MSLNTDHLLRCIQTLESSLKMLQKNDSETIEYEMFRNSAVKGFELTLEISSKLLRKALKPYFATSKSVDRLTFKDVFRHAARHGLLTTKEVERWFLYRENRNNTTHDYGKGFAEETLGLLPDFVKDVKSLKEKLKSC